MNVELHSKDGRVAEFNVDDDVVREHPVLLFKGQYFLYKGMAGANLHGARYDQINQPVEIKR